MPLGGVGVLVGGGEVVEMEEGRIFSSLSVGSSSPSSSSGRGKKEFEGRGYLQELPASRPTDIAAAPAMVAFAFGC